jgi:hypothetical protein
MLETDGLLRAIGGSHLQRVGRRKLADALYHVHLALLRQPAQPFGQLADYAFLEAAHAVDVDLRLTETHAVGAHFFCVGNHLRHVQQRFRRDAADIEADAAEGGVTLYKCHLLAEIGGAECSGITTGAAAEHQYFGVDFVAT